MSEAVNRVEQADFQAGSNELAQLKVEASPADQRAQELREALAGQSLADKLSYLQQELKTAATAARPTLSSPQSGSGAETAAAAQAQLMGVQTEYSALLQANPDLVGPLYHDKLSRAIGQHTSGRPLITGQDRNRARTMLSRSQNGWVDAELALLQTEFMHQPGVTEDIKSAVVDYAIEQQASLRPPEATAEIAAFVDSAALRDKLAGPDQRDHPATTQTQLVETARAAVEAAAEPGGSEPEAVPSWNELAAELKLTDEAKAEFTTAEQRDLVEFKAALESMRFQFQDVAVQLRPGIEAHRWDAIIGDDVSGRLPALFVGRLMQRHAAATGAATPNIMFAAPDKMAGEEKQQALREHFANHQDKLGHRVLIVTEFIASGDNLRGLVATLPQGVEADIASLRVSRNFDDDYQRYAFPRSSIYYGDVWSEPPLYARRPTEEASAAERKGISQGIIGIEKDETSATSHRRIVGHDERGRIIPRDRGQFISQARRLLYDFADKMYDQTFVDDEDRRAA